MAPNFRVDTTVYDVFIEKILSLPMNSIHAVFFGWTEWNLFLDNYAEKTREMALSNMQKNFHWKEVFERGWHARISFPHAYMDLTFFPQSLNVNGEVFKSGARIREFSANMRADVPNERMRVLNKRFFFGGAESSWSSDVCAVFDWVEELD